MWYYIVTSVLILLLSIVYQYYSVEPISIIEKPRDRYDYIIVGAGTAGCVIASQLALVSNVSVLLIEAGGYFGWLSTVPLAAPLMQGTSVDWKYKTERQYYSSGGLVNQQQSWPRGKGLGGSGQLNYLVHSFGVPEDYDDWPPGWSREDLYPYFQRVARKMLSSGKMNERRLIEAFESLNASAFSGNVSLETARSTIERGARWSSYHAYLRNSWNRSNLHILANTFVTKILNDEGFDARGVEIQYRDGTLGRLEANEEIIICAGAVNTPQLLMLSGIGPLEQLRQHRVPIIKALPQVGKNLFDHLNMPMYVNLNAPVSVTLQKMMTLAEVIKYWIFGSGIFASNGIIGTVRVAGSILTMFEVASADEKLLKDIANFKTDTFRSLFPSYNDTGHEGFIYLASCLRPKSRGNITLRSRNIFDPPSIEPAYLKDDHDITCTQQAVNAALESLETQEFRRLGANVHVPDLKNCQNFRQDYHDPRYVECVIRTAGLAGHHPGGTCKIGANSEDSVVDYELRVHGIKKLRIMDASIFPSPISGGPNSVIMALAEKAVDLILNRTRETFLPL